MLSRNEILIYLEANKGLFRSKFDVVKLGVFGSFAREEQKQTSDIDIIIEMPRGTEDIFEKKMALREMIKQHFARDVDICRERAIKPLFKEMILKEAIYV